MASESGSGSGPSDPLLPGAGEAHHRRPTTGGWRSALFIIWVEVAERFAYYGVSLNLINYLTGPLGETTAAAAAAVNAWSGAASMLPLLGAAVADSWLGRYRTIVVSSVLYTTFRPRLAGAVVHIRVVPEPTMQQLRRWPARLPAFLRADGLPLRLPLPGGHRPERPQAVRPGLRHRPVRRDGPRESSARSSFFNWWYLGICASATVTVALMSYVKDNVRFYDGGSTRVEVAGVGKAVRAWRKRRREGGGDMAEQEHGECECAETAVLAEEVRGMARLFPIWAACLLYGVVFAQPPTLFTKQAATLDRRIGPSFQVPPAALQSFLGVSIIPCVLLYDRVLVPVARCVTDVASGITTLQRIGAGIALSMAALVVAALVETKRLSSAAAVPMSLWWIVPQYMMLGAADVFAMVGMQEFFYDQVPAALKSLGLAFYLSVLDVGSFISSFLISVIDGVTRRGGGTSWFDDDLNRGHLDYFYLLLAALTLLDLLAYLYFSTSYKYRTKAINVH